MEGGREGGRVLQREGGEGGREAGRGRQAGRQGQAGRQAGSE